MTHVSHQFHAHQLHFVVDEIACAVARVGGQHDLSTRFGFNGVHHLERLHLEAFRDLQCNQAVVVGADALHQLVQFEVVAVEIHAPPQSAGVAPPS